MFAYLRLLMEMSFTLKGVQCKKEKAHPPKIPVFLFSTRHIRVLLRLFEHYSCTKQLVQFTGDSSLEM